MIIGSIPNKETIKLSPPFGKHINKMNTGLQTNSTWTNPFLNQIVILI